MSKLGTVCAFFNPCNYQSRRRNYDIFRTGIERSGVTLLTVELIFDENGESGLGSCGDVLRIRGGDVMWQKERLLQIGIDHLLREGFSAVGWLDADIVFDDKNWHENVLRTLDRYDCVQSFDQLVSHFQEGTIVGSASASDPRLWSPGGSWAATSAFWQDVELYQYCILGGADTVMANVFLQMGRHDGSEFDWHKSNLVVRQFNGPMRAHVLAWAKAIMEAISYRTRREPDGPSVRARRQASPILHSALAAIGRLRSRHRRQDFRKWRISLECRQAAASRTSAQVLSSASRGRLAKSSASQHSRPRNQSISFPRTWNLEPSM